MSDLRFDLAVATVLTVAVAWREPTLRDPGTLLMGFGLSLFCMRCVTGQFGGRRR